jgi:hypothetical protein
MKSLGLLAVAWPLLVVSAPAGAFAQAGTIQTPEQAIEERAVNSLKGKPAIAIFGVASLSGATSGLSVRNIYHG